MKEATSRQRAAIAAGDLELSCYRGIWDYKLIFTLREISPVSFGMPQPVSCRSAHLSCFSHALQLFESFLIVIFAGRENPCAELFIFS